MLKKDVMEWENKERIMNEQLKGKVENVYEQSKKAQNLQGELFIVQEKLRQVQVNFEERRTSDQKSIREKDKQLSQRGEELTTIQLQMMEVKEELASANQELAIRGN